MEKQNPSFTFFVYMKILYITKSAVSISGRHMYTRSFPLNLVFFFFTLSLHVIAIDTV